jgi:hypothetical protein
MLHHLFAQTYTYTTSPDGSTTGLAIFSGVWLLFWLAFAVLFIAAMWRLYSKAGQPGWAAIVPFYNIYVLLQIAGRPGWWLILWLVPVVNLVVSIIVGIDVAKRFGHSDVFGAILCGLLSIGYLIIGFGSAQYQGAGAPAAQPAAPTQTPPAEPTPPSDNVPPQAQ